MQDDHLIELAAEIDIEAFLDEEGVTYRRTRGTRGVQLNLKTCPKCEGDSWKVYLNADTGLGNCFHGDCETKFNKLTFIHALRGNRRFAETVEQVEGWLKTRGWQPKRKKEVEVKQVEAGEIKLPAHFTIPYQGMNLQYLEQRGITAEIAARFQLLYCDKGWFGYTLDGEEKFQGYHQRVIIPVFDMTGKLVSFQGRDTTGRAPKKYLFPPGLAGTGAYLYNAHRVIGKEIVVVGEGAFDVIATEIALETTGAGCVGTFGKHISGVTDSLGGGDENTQVGEFMKLKKAGLKTIVFMWDGEKKARAAAVKAGLYLRSLGFVTRLAILPDDKDPNEVPAEVVRDAFWSAPEITPLAAMRWKAQGFV